jgi:hypothetical protein
MSHGENKFERGEPAMSIEKKSLISTLKTTKKANAVKDDLTGGAKVGPTQKLPNRMKPSKLANRMKPSKLANRMKPSRLANRIR